MSKKVLLVLVVSFALLAALTVTVLAATSLSTANFDAVIGGAARLYVYPSGSSSHQCRTNGAGDNPSDLLAMYEVGGVPYVLGQYGSGTRLYWGPSGLPGIRQCLSTMTMPAPAVGNTCKYTTPGSYGINLGDGITVEHDAKTNRVAFVKDCGKFLGRTNGHTDNGQLLAAWMSNGVPYALVQRPPTNGRNPLIVITPRNNAGSVKLVDIVNP